MTWGAFCSCRINITTENRKRPVCPRIRVPVFAVPVFAPVFATLFPSQRPHVQNRHVGHPDSSQCQMSGPPAKLCAQNRKRPPLLVRFLTLHSQSRRRVRARVVVSSQTPHSRIPSGAQLVLLARMKMSMYFYAKPDNRNRRPVS